MHLAPRRAVLQQQVVRVRVDVDEPRRDHLALRVDHALRLARGSPDGDDLVATDADIAESPGIASAIDNATTTDDEVKLRGLIVGGEETGCGQCSQGGQECGT